MPEFLDNILPGNYWITKSMEFSKTSTSGTLWYLKKWLVYYQFIFFRRTLQRQDYTEIATIFNEYIEQLPEQIQEAAEKFFFSVNIKGDSFLTLNEYINTGGGTFDNERAEEDFNREAKKFYFVYVMGLGGQAGYKKQIKELLEERHSHNEIREIMYTRMQKEGRGEGYINQQFSDYHAPLRNERQIFFYYGLFHGSERSDLGGFYRLTTVGATMLRASPEELKIVWEHQKLKMISQTPLTDITLSEKTQENINHPERFGIRYHPYYTLLKAISLLGNITQEVYQFIISRIRETDNLEEIVASISDGQLDPNSIEQLLAQFERRGDLESEDFTKELKKFVLGISNFSLDNETNDSAILKLGRDITILRKDKFEFLLNIYGKITQYLDSQYLLLYQSCESFLRESYVKRAQGNPEKARIVDTYEWSRYIINIDFSLLINTLYGHTALRLEEFGYKISRAQFKEIYPFYINMMAAAGISSSNEFIELMIEVQSTLADGRAWTSGEDEAADAPTPIETGIDLARLEALSQTKIASIKRVRNGSLIRALRSLYVTNYASPATGLVPCDACTEETFFTTQKVPYLEFHHIIPFSTDNGPDHYLNLVGICPDCHRIFTFGEKRIRTERYGHLSTNNHLKINLYDRALRLYTAGMLEPLNVEFLYKEGILSEPQYNTFMNQDPIAPL